jgi:hypothetical protein
VGFPVSWSDLRLQLHPSAVLRLPDFMASDRAQQIDSDRRRSSFSRRAAVHFQIGRPFCADQPLAHSRRLFFTAGGQPSKWRIMAGAALCFLAASVHPYIVVMVLLIDAATHLRVATSAKKPQKPLWVRGCA